MQGSSPYANGYQSPSFHSSSYMPKLEAQFMKDFSCCGITLASLHELLQHYEEAHAQQLQQTVNNQYPPKPPGSQNFQARNPSQPGGVAVPTSKASTQMNISGSEAAAAAHQSVPAKFQQDMSFGPLPAQPPAQDMEAVEDMEMDDEPENTDPNMPVSSHMTHNGLSLADSTGIYGQRAQYAPPSARMPNLNLDTMQHENPLQNFQGIRQSQPNTPIANTGRPAPVFHHNPTVSSVNTPTLSAHPRHPRQMVVSGAGTPDSSAPGTPRELDADFVGGVGNMSMDNSGQNLGAFPPIVGHGQGAMGGYGYGMGSNSGIGQLYIDEPAKALSQPQGGETPGQLPPGKNRLGTAHYGPDSPLAKTIREQQRKVGLADTVEGIGCSEPKPFRCPVIGCEKAYKNQNGLKYHKAVR